MKTRKIRVETTLVESAKFFPWLRESSIPFRAKLPHQIKWSCSRKASLFFARFERTKIRTQTVKIDLIIRVSDYQFLRMRLIMGGGKMCRYREPKMIW